MMLHESMQHLPVFEYICMIYERRVRNMSEFLTEYIRSELFVLVPVLWFVGKGLKKSEVNDRFIPVILGTLGVVLACVYIAASCEINSVGTVLGAVFAGITQGLLCAGASVYFNEIIRNLKKKN